MSFDITFLIVIFSPVIGIMSLIVGKPAIKEKTNKKLPLYLCDIACVLGLIIFISFIICSRSERIDPKYTYTEYPIEKMTFDNVYFNNRGGDSLNKSYVIVEEPNDKYQNVVVVEKEEYIIQWFYKVKITTNKYHIYLSEDVYNRWQDGSTIYEGE